MRQRIRLGADLNVPCITMTVSKLKDACTSTELRPFCGNGSAIPLAGDEYRSLAHKLKSARDQEGLTRLRGRSMAATACRSTLAATGKGGRAWQFSLTSMPGRIVQLAGPW